MVSALWLDPRNPSIVLAGTWTNGIYRSINGGTSWSLRYRINAVTGFVGTGQDITASTAYGLLASSDSGQSWSMYETFDSAVRALAENGPSTYVGLQDGRIERLGADVISTYSPPSAATVWSLAVDPSNANLAYAVEWPYSSATSLLRTTDGGKTWTSLSLGAVCGYRAQGVTAAAGVLVIAGEGGSCVSTDEGMTWRSLNAPWDNRAAFTWPGAPNTYVLGSDQGLYETTDAGSTWRSLSTGVTSSLTTGVAVSGSTILASLQDFSAYASYDGGATWTTPIPGSGENGTVLFNPGNSSYAYACTSSGLSVSSDGGRSFSPTTGLPAGPCDTLDTGASGQFAVDPSNPSTLYTGNTSGVYRSTDWGRTWTKTSWNIEAQGIAIDPTNSEDMLISDCCTSNTSIEYTTDGGSTWHQSAVPAANGPIDVMAYDPLNPSIVLAGGIPLPGGNGGVWKSTDGGHSFVLDNAGIRNYWDTQYSFVSAIEFAPHSSVVAIGTSAGTYISQSGDGWQSVQGNMVPIIATGIDWTSANTLYVSTFGEGVLRGTLSESSAVSTTTVPSPKGASVSIMLRVHPATFARQLFDLYSGVTRVVRSGLIRDVQVCPSTLPCTASHVVGYSVYFKDQRLWPRYVLHMSVSGANIRVLHQGMRNANPKYPPSPPWFVLTGPGSPQHPAVVWLTVEPLSAT